MNQSIKNKIDALSIEELLRDHRFAPIGSTMFQGKEGEYRIKRLSELRNKDNDAYVNASKSIGWGAI